MKTYPLEGDKNLLQVCWSEKQWRRGGYDTGAITHIVHRNGHKTLCGVPIGNEILYANWEFQVWDISDNLGVENVGCLRCKRSTRLTTAARDPKSRANNRVPGA